MNRILAAVKLDYLAGRFYLALYPVLFLVGLFIGAAVKMPVFTVILVIVLAVFIAGGVFATYERNHGEKLHGTLPLRRQDIVLGRYIYALIIGVGGTVAAGILGYLAARIAGVNMGSFGPNRSPLTTDTTVASVIFWFAIGAAFMYFCFAISVAFPIYFRFGFAKSYVFTMLPLYLVMLLALLITRKLDPSLELSNTIQFFADHLYLLPSIGVAGGLILLAISISISNAIYAHKEI
jgi:uncharacterized membrane protein